MPPRIRGGGGSRGRGGVVLRAKKKIIKRNEWQNRLNDVKIRKEDMNKLVMNFLVTEGYDDAVREFRMESGTEPGIDVGILVGIKEVQKALHSGNAEASLTILQNLNPQILDKCPALVFILSCERFIELIKIGKVAEALAFSQEELAPMVKKHTFFFSSFSFITTLLSFKDDANSPVACILANERRFEIAKYAKRAILRSQNHTEDPILQTVLKLLVKEQKRLYRKHSYPRILDLSSTKLDPISEEGENP